MSYTLSIHGGAGTILRSQMSSEKETAYLAALQDALRTGEKILKAGGSALDAVCDTVICLENNVLFNAGRGSVFTHLGTQEMDASIMDGKNRMAGAVAGVSGVRNPVLLARKIMENTEHVFLSGAGAEEFAKIMKLPFESPEYFFDDFRYQQWQSVKNSNTTILDHTDDRKFGTVGAAARDVHGNLAAATSTGGMTNKKFSRIGDTPLIGAGTYANNATCAVSCTGHGEFFMRGVVAYDISCLMEYAGMSLREACNKVVMQKLVDIGGEGGIIAVDAAGNAEMVFNSDGMYRGCVRENEPPVVAIYR